MRELRELSAILGTAFLAISPLLHPHPHDATDGGLFRLGIAAIAVAVVLFVLPIVGRFVGLRVLQPGLRIAFGNSGEFDKVDIANPPDEYLGEELEANLTRAHAEMPTAWVRIRKVARVTSRTAVKDCRAAITELAPHDSLDTLPAALLWHHTNTETCDIPPGGHAYAVLHERYRAVGGDVSLQSQHPVVTLSVENDAALTVTAWANDTRSAKRSVRLSGLRALHESPVAETVQLFPIHAINLVYVKLSHPIRARGRRRAAR